MTNNYFEKSSYNYQTKKSRYNYFLTTNKVVITTVVITTVVITTVVKSAHHCCSLCKWQCGNKKTDYIQTYLMHRGVYPYTLGRNLCHCQNQGK